MAQLYGQRWTVELDLRYLKAQMDLGFLESHSAELARKKWWAGLIAYNLIRWTMAAGAAVAQVPYRSCPSVAPAVCSPTGRPAAPNTAAASTPGNGCSPASSRAGNPNGVGAAPPSPGPFGPPGSDVPPLHGSRAEARQKLANSLVKSE